MLTGVPTLIPPYPEVMSFMNSLKCINCGLTNFPDVFDCRRCGESLFSGRQQKARTQTPRWLSVWSLLMIALVLGVVYYFYQGVQREMDEIDANEAQRIATQPKQQPGFPRSQSDRQRAGQVGDAVKNSAALNTAQRHNLENEAAMQQVSGVNTTNK